MSVKEDYLTSYREFFEHFAATVNPEDQLPVQVAGYTITEAELPGEILLWTTQYLNEKNCPKTLLTPLRRIILDEVLTASKKQPQDFGFRADDSVYIALRLMQAVAAKVNDICLRYLDNAQLDKLPPPPARKELRTTSAALKNSRRVMEDRHVEIGNLEALFGIETTEPTSFYAVYDGHAGSAAAVYCAAHLHQYLVESTHFSTDLQAALKEAFLRTDADFVRKSNQERANGGSTAVVVTVRGKTLHAAWAGDSQALLAKRMRLMQLVHPHKPSRQDEKDRIEASGGTVMFWGTWRVNGQLAVSRAIGDAPYKPYVTARPEIATVDLDGDEDFVVVACDGLWDFVSEDQVALAVYWQIAADPDDLEAVTRRLVVQAKRQGSVDNISVIVVFLKEPRDIAADNCPPMDLGLDNALASAPPPFPVDGESCKRQLDPSLAEADNGVEHSDSDSEDLGPETAVDADDVDAEKHQERAVTPPASAVEAEGQIDSVLADNVAESGEDSEDEWNYFKGEGEQQTESQNLGEDPEDLPPSHSDTPCQDNSAWESSSVDMNSSPLNPDAPVFIPGTVAGSDVLLAESPRKPLPMDDIELPDVKQFETEAIVRPKELVDLDNCDQLNGHHNISLDEATKLNGNDKCLDSLGFGFSMGDEKDKDNLIQDFDRIQKDTTDFCNIQVVQTHTETNPFTTEGNKELLERLKNKERDPMSMSFYQEKDDDTCDRLGANDSRVDLNAVQLLPDSEDEDLETNGDYDNQSDKENVFPQHTDLLGTINATEEPNNDILDNNMGDFGATDNILGYPTNNIQNLTNIDFETRNEEMVLQTETPESHKLLFEQIPEIPDGKNSELGFTDDNQVSESDNRPFSAQDEISQDVEMESKLEDSPLVENLPEIGLEQNEEPLTSPVASPEPIQQIEEDRDSGVTTGSVQGLEMDQELDSALPEEQKAITPEPTNEFDYIGADVKEDQSFPEKVLLEAPEIIFEADVEPVVESPLRVEASPVPIHSPVPTEELISQSPVPQTDRLSSPAPAEVPLPSESPIPEPVPSPTPVEPSASPLQVKATSPTPIESFISHSPLPSEVIFTHSPIPSDTIVPHSPIHSDTPHNSIHSDTIVPHSPIHSDTIVPHCPIHSDTMVPHSPIHSDTIVPHSPIHSDNIVPHSPIYSDTIAPHSPIHSDTIAPHSPIHSDNIVPHSPIPSEPEALSRLTSEVAAEAGPTPDIVPEETFDAPSEPVTDLDIGIQESRAQEICVPVTSEIQDEASKAPEVPIAADVASEAQSEAPIAAVAAVAALAGVAAVAANTKSASPTKKATTPAAKTTTKLTPKPTTTPKTPLSATKKPTTTIQAARPASARTPTKPSSATLKLGSTTPKPASTTPKPSTPKPTATSPKPPPITRPATATTKPATAKPLTATAAKPLTATAAKPLTATAAKPLTATAKTTTAKPSTRLAPKPAAPRTLAAKPKEPVAKAPISRVPPRPLTNGAPRPAASRVATAPPRVAPAAAAPRAAPATLRAAPAPAAPRVAAPRPTPRVTAAAKDPLSAAPRPAPRAAHALDKPGKELANRRVTAKAPTRTAATKAPAKPNTMKPVPKKAVEAKKSEEMNGLTNGSSEPVPALAHDKQPPSPDNALLPDVIA